MRRYWILAIAGAIAATLAVPLTASAASNAVLSTGSANPNGTNVAKGDTLIGTLSGSAVFQNQGGNEKVTCTTSSITASDVSNPATPGTATETDSAQTFGNCTTTGLFGARINSITTSATSTCPWNASVNDNNGVSPATVTVTPATAGGSCGSSPAITADVNVTALGQTFDCNYSANNGQLSGTAPLGSSAGITFSSQRFNGQSGNSVLCFSPAFFTATYQFTDGGAAVFTN